MFARIILVSFFKIVIMYVPFFPLLESKCEKCFYTTCICISKKYGFYVVNNVMCDQEFLSTLI